jgi:hypothetical protein
MTPYHRQVLNRFDSACRDYAWKGSYHPDDCAAVEVEYERARAAMIRALDKVPDNRPKTGKVVR